MRNDKVPLLVFNVMSICLKIKMINLKSSHKKRKMLLDRPVFPKCAVIQLWMVKLLHHKNNNNVDVCIVG